MTKVTPSREQILAKILHNSTFITAKQPFGARTVFHTSDGDRIIVRSNGRSRFGLEVIGEGNVVIPVLRREAPFPYDDHSLHSYPWQQEAVPSRWRSGARYGWRAGEIAAVVYALFEDPAQWLPHGASFGEKRIFRSPEAVAIEDTSCTPKATLGAFPWGDFFYTRDGASYTHIGHLTDARLLLSSMLEGEFLCISGPPKKGAPFAQIAQAGPFKTIEVGHYGKGTRQVFTGTPTYPDYRAVSLPLRRVDGQPVMVHANEVFRLKATEILEVIGCWAAYGVLPRWYGMTPPPAAI